MADALRLLYYWRFSLRNYLSTSRQTDYHFFVEYSAFHWLFAVQCYLLLHQFCPWFSVCLTNHHVFPITRCRWIVLREHFSLKRLNSAVISLKPPRPKYLSSTGKVIKLVVEGYLSLDTVSSITCEGTQAFSLHFPVEGLSASGDYNFLSPPPFLGLSIQVWFFCGWAVVICWVKVCLRSWWVSIHTHDITMWRSKSVFPPRPWGLTFTW